MSFDPAALHFLRPGWLWALLALPLLPAWWWLRRRRSAWAAAVDAHLLPYLLERGGGRTALSRRLGWMPATLAYLLAVLALAGPSWRQVEQPLWHQGDPLVVALDLSSASLATDLPPSRLAQARARLEALLHGRRGGQVGLVAYAGDAFTVAPLTEDAANVALFLDSLAPDVMPVDGQRADRAIRWSAGLLRQAGFTGQGTIVLLTNRADADARAAAAEAHARGYRVSVLGLGTAAGGTHAVQGGQVGHSRLDAAALRALAAAGGGVYAEPRADGGEWRALDVLDPTRAGAATAAAPDDGRGRMWLDEGYWLLPPLLLLGLFAFRRGTPALALLLAFGLGAGVPAGAARAAELWQRPDQVDHSRLEAGTRAYRAGEFARAAELYARVGSADGHYNRGNALARAGRYEDAIAAYNQALAVAPGMADALANRAAVEAELRRRQQQRQDARQNDQQSGQQNPRPNPQSGQQSSAADPGQSGSPDPAREGQVPEPRPGEPAPQSPPDTEGGGPPPPEGADEQAQQAADQAQRERMQRALEQAGPDAADPAAAPEPAPETPEQRERRIANEAWLRRVPDDPGGLLREKFRLEYERRRLGGGGEE